MPPAGGVSLDVALRAYMLTHNVRTHAEMGEILGVDRTLISKYLSGARQCSDISQLRRFAELLGVPYETFGLSAVSATDVSVDVTRWRVTRQALNQNRHTLTSIAADLYWAPQWIEATRCLTVPGWLPPMPVELGAIELTWQDAARPPITGTEDCTAQFIPELGGAAKGPRYSQAIKALARPALFENRISYRLLDLRWSEESGRMSFGMTTYFDMVDVCELLAHEVAAVWLTDRRVTMSELPFRTHVGDLFNLRRRVVLPSINTLTIRRSPDGDRFFLHRRAAASVTTAAGLSHVIPAGVFQPSGIGPENISQDFDLWRSILREYSEEMLGNIEHDGSASDSVDYHAEPFRTLNNARASGRVRAWCLGVGIDPLTPAGEILTVVTIEADVFDAVFAELVEHNAEGDLYPSTIGIPWSAANIRKVMEDEPLACAAAACIALTWKHRKQLLP